MAAIATFALKPGVWFRRVRLVIVSPDSQRTACLLSGRNSTYRPVQISGTSSLCAFHLGKWEADESVEDAYHRELNITAAQFHRMRMDNNGALQEKHADAIHRMYEAAGVNLTTATEAEKASLRLRLMDEARKGGMRFPA